MIRNIQATFSTVKTTVLKEFDKQYVIATKVLKPRFEDILKSFKPLTLKNKPTRRKKSKSKTIPKKTSQNKRTQRPKSSPGLPA